MAKCPKCKAEILNPTKDWKYGIFKVKMYLCKCGNRFNEYFREGKVQFVLSAHNGKLGGRRKTKK